ncbi:MAG: hypothetical protein OXN17_03370 [Candidatus Poribacteria bacterium]|nr:hypothetical protein [Candidatus Poribacteria bacterium]MDE0506521.1 hypothetical protein [Candidatus Poribacteria bacterium]
MSIIKLITAWVLEYWLWIAILSALTAICTFIGFTAFIISLPEDYFRHKAHVNRIRNPIIRISLRVLKNAVGVITIIAGLVMTITPGQGLVAILVGVILCDFPGKHKLERKLIARPLVLNTLNKIRSRFNRPPIEL